MSSAGSPKYKDKLVPAELVMSAVSPSGSGPAGVARPTIGDINGARTSAATQSAPGEQGSGARAGIRHVSFGHEWSNDPYLEEKAKKQIHF